MKKLFIAGAALLLSLQVLAYPITPRPLRKMVIESEVIIHGKVVELTREKSTSKNDHWNLDVAIISVIQVLQGEVKTQTIRVYYTAGLICPAPPEYIVDQEAIIFLDRYEKNKGAYETHALSYGVKNGLDAEGINVYKQRIKEMQDILQMPSCAKRDELTMEWIVTCALNKYTRWEGTYELSPGSDFMSTYDETDPVRKEAFLTTAQRKRIFDAIFAADTLSYDDIALVDITRGVDDQRLLGYLKTGLVKLDGEDHSFTAYCLTLRIASLTGDDELNKLSEEFESVIFEREKEKGRKDIFKKIVARMQNLELKKTVYAAGDGN